MQKVMLLASKDLCDTLQSALENTYITLPCYDSDAGKERLPQKPDILILNLFLPGKDGLAFLEDNADLLPSKIIALTPFVNSVVLDRLSRLGVSSVLRLPVALDRLCRQLDDLCAKKCPSR